MRDSLMAGFNSVAGASFGVFGINHLDHSQSDSSFIAGVLDEALFGWLIICESLARHDDEHEAWQWLEDQLFRAAGYHKEPFASLCTLMQSHWSTITPLLLMPIALRRRFVDTLELSRFVSEDQRPVRVLLITLFDRYGDNLFTPGNWLIDLKNEAKFSSPNQACVVKLGLTLKWLKESSSAEYRDRWGQWQDQLRSDVLDRLPRRIERGFSPDSPLFEDVVLALLAVAEWLSYDSASRITPYLADVKQRPAERLTDDQMVLAGALYGYTVGYRRVGNLIPWQIQRAVVSRQSLCLAIKHQAQDWLGPNRTLSPVFQATARGTYSAFLAPFLTFSRLEQTEYSLGASGYSRRMETRCRLWLHAAERAFSFICDTQLVSAAGM